MDVPLITSGCTVSVDKFWESVMVYHNRPHLVNKKIAGVVQAYFYEVHSSLNKLLEYFTHAAIIYEVRRLPQLTKDSLNNIIKDILQPFDKNVVLKDTNITDFPSYTVGVFISVRILIPKLASSKKCVEIVLLDKQKNFATFIATIEENDNIIAPRFPYRLEYIPSNHIRCVVNNFEDADTNSAVWLVDKLFMKIIKWAQEDTKVNAPQEALKLITVDRYTHLYQNMKEKYGKEMIQIWPENTDPLKFVYEDIAIATYLMCLWESIDNTRKPSFVDLGCGNGLLVYILTQEGYNGIGVDIRKRKIWDLYPPNVKLEERVIVPSSSSLFPGTEWIIGNHSDELTPWIPVIASRSSHETNFFLLPCCAYDFSGKKYSRVNTSKSVYNEYIEYIKNVCITCGFITKVDKLKIPSTKRTCLISYGRAYRKNEFTDIDKGITDFIKARSQSKNEFEDNWAIDFKPRPVEEKVRNCTKLNRNLVHQVVLKLVNKLLEVDNIIPSQQRNWNAGGSFAIKDLITAVPDEDLKQLKSNCGGLQTLMRNHRYIFEVEKGIAKLRVPATYDKVTIYKEKLCWFFNNHPDGCLNSLENCAYKHVLINAH